MNTTYKKFFIIIGTIFVVIILFVLVATYLFRFESPAINSLRKTFHLPAMIVDGQWVSITEIEENTASIKQFYESQDFSPYGIRIDFTTSDGKRRLQIQERKMLNKLIEDTIIEKMAKEWNITLSDEAVQSAMERPMDEMGSRDSVESKLERLYGWSLHDFGEKVVRGQLLREKVAANFEQQNTVTQDMHGRIEQAKKELDDGRDFADVATKYSDGRTADEGGIMGWFNENQLQDEIGKNISQINAGKYSTVLETPLGLHIVRVNDISEEGDIKLVHISQIVVRKKTFAEFLTERIVAMKVQEFLPEYEWDKESGFIIFSNDEMADFEKKTQEEANAIEQEMLDK